MDGNARTSRVSSGFPPSSDGRQVLYISIENVCALSS